MGDVTWTYGHALAHAMRLGGWLKRADFDFFFQVVEQQVQAEEPAGDQLLEAQLTEHLTHPNIVITHKTVSRARAVTPTNPPGLVWGTFLCCQLVHSLTCLMLATQPIQPLI